MALIKCTQCGHMISDKAEKCPKCGLPTKDIETFPKEIFEEESKKKKGWLWTLIVGMLLCVIAGVYFAYVHLSQDDTNREVSVEKKDSVIVEEEKADIVKLTPTFIKAIKKYLEIGVFSDGMAAVQTANGKWGYINTRGEEAIPAKIDAIFVGRFSDGLAFVCPDVDGGSSCYVIDQTGKRIFDVKNYYLDACGEGMCSEDMPYFIEGKLYVPTFVSSDFKYTIYDTHGKRIGTVGYEEGDAYYKNHEIGDYAIISKNSGGLDDYDENGHDMLYGLKDLSGRQLLAPKYDAINRKREGTTNFGNGVVLVTLTEFCEDEDGEDGRVIFHYGYADMEGNDTFSSELKKRCKRSKIEAKEKFGNQDECNNNYNDNNYRSSTNEDYSWLNGNWRYRMQSYGQTLEMRVGISGDMISVFINSEHFYTGKYTIEDNHLVYNRHNGMADYLVIDKKNHRLKADENNYMERF